ncbi:MAG: alpha-1,2-fucosyltransferase [Candidatus Riflebacteria bacterium]|nr:alpha-1,2-fucosyltransferase [Candidatus Riflebacteria bacterium]
MKIVRLFGGLGNQMFQYAFAKLLQSKTSEIVKIDFSYFNFFKENDSIRVPRLFNFNLTLEEATCNDIDKVLFFKNRSHPNSPRYSRINKWERKINRKYYLESNDDMTIKPIEQIIKNSYFDGYWQSWKYVDAVWEELQNDFLPKEKLSDKTQAAIEQVKNEDSVFIGIRRGDYTKYPSLYGSFGQDYFDKAIQVIESKVNSPVYYIFSDDIPWVKNNIDLGERKIFYREKEDIVTDFEELMLMASCKHSIIINSTFHWWGARLREYDGKVVVAPEKWFFDGRKIEIIPARWITI